MIYPTINTPIDDIDKNILSTTTKYDFNEFLKPDTGALDKIIRAAMYPSFNFGFAVDCKWPSGNAGDIFIYCFPFILPNLGCFAFKSLSAMALPSGHSNEFVEYEDFGNEIGNLDNYDINATDFIKEIGLGVYWPFVQPYNSVPGDGRAGFSVSSTTTQNYSIALFPGMYSPGIFDETPNKVGMLCPPPILSNADDFISASSLNALNKWCDNLLYTPLMLWVQNSTPPPKFFNDFSQNVHGCASIRNGSGTNSYVTPSGYLDQSAYSVVHWVPFRKSCPSFCNVLHIAVGCSRYMKNQNYYYGAPIITIQIGNNVYRLTMQWHVSLDYGFPTNEEDSCFDFYLVEINWSEDFSNQIIGNRDYWPVQIKEIYMPYSTTEGGTKDQKYTNCVQSISAWLGGSKIL